MCFLKENLCFFDNAQRKHVDNIMFSLEFTKLAGCSWHQRKKMWTCMVAFFFSVILTVDSFWFQLSRFRNKKIILLASNCLNVSCSIHFSSRSIIDILLSYCKKKKYIFRHFFQNLWEFFYRHYSNGQTREQHIPFSWLCHNNVT